MWSIRIYWSLSSIQAVKLLAALGCISDVSPNQTVPMYQYATLLLNNLLTNGSTERYLSHGNESVAPYYHNGANTSRKGDAMASGIIYRVMSSRYDGSTSNNADTSQLYLSLISYWIFEPIKCLTRSRFKIILQLLLNTSDWFSPIAGFQ